MCDNVCIGEICLLVFAIFSTFLYVAFMVTIFKNRHSEELGNGFFRIAALLGVADLIFVWAGNFFFVIPEQLGIPSPATFGGVTARRFGFALLSIGRMGQILGVALLTINRLIVVLCPLDHELV